MEEELEALRIRLDDLRRLMEDTTNGFSYRSVEAMDEDGLRDLVWDQHHNAMVWLSDLLDILLPLEKMKIVEFGKKVEEAKEILLGLPAPYPEAQAEIEEEMAVLSYFW